MSTQPLTAEQKAALGKAIEAGGKNLTGTLIAGSGRVATALLKGLCDAGFLGKSGTKYTVTDAGRGAYQTSLSPDERRELERAEEEKRQKTARAAEESQRKFVRELVAIVAGGNGRALTAAQQRRFPEEVRQTACDKQLIAATDRPNVYRVLPAGEVLILADQSAESLLAEVRQLADKLFVRLRAAKGALSRLVQEPGDEILASAVGSIDVDVAQTAFAEVMAQMTAAPKLVQAAHDYREAIDARARERAKQIETGLATLETKIADLRAVEAAIREEQPRLVAFAEQVEARLAGVPTRAVEPEPDAEEVWEVTKRAANDLRTESHRSGGIVKIPELTDRVRKSLPDVSVGQFHALLQQWASKGRITLQVSNDRLLEPRAGEGIESDRGLLFYVFMR